MVESSMAESDITVMKETLRAQQQLLQKLYAELDKEREASATAASETMDMILRLQGEKAAVKMEASHYKRMAEEKIGHAEATLEVFEELMYQKEMEIASLEFQILAYRNKLLTLGYDFNASDLEFTEELLMSRSASNDQGENDRASSSTVRRLTSLPPIPLKNNLKSARKRERSPSPVPVLVPDTFPRIVESDGREATSPSMDLPTKSEDYAEGSLDAYWNQIMRLDEKVKVISDCKESEGEQCTTLRSRRGRSGSIFSQANIKLSTDQTDTSCSGKENQTQDREAVVIPSCSSNIHDVFEVPQTGEPGKRRLEKWISDADNRLTKPDLVSDEIIGSHVKYDMDKLKSMLSANLESRIPSPKDMKAIVWKKKEGVDVDCNAIAEFQKLNQRIDQLERETVSAMKEIMNEVKGEEHLNLLKDICSQLKSMESEMRSEKTPKPPPKRDTPLDPIQEVIYSNVFAFSFEKK
ncbi:hypothetical protein LR48_Vigan01g242100 [Vigna angularis]|uniref:GTD-binding domain-containing protein n=1 Tax=Phaseolus angularis TaxID=3914 RepID=A0A0L9TQN0_PHAAN|nr:hypothetical protein LR48_Vigan01g242100 [Vigna angularis]